MQQEQIHADIEVLCQQLGHLKEEMDTAIKGGKSFIEVKLIHLQIKELNKLIEGLTKKNREDYLRAV